MKFNIVVCHWDGSTQKVARKIKAQDARAALGQYLRDVGLGTEWGNNVDHEVESDCGCVRSIKYVAPLRESIIPGLYHHPVVSQLDVSLTPCPRHEIDADRGIEGRFEARADRWL